MIVYIVTFSVMILLTHNMFNGKYDFGRIISFVILSLFVGFRYDVGVDYLSYKAAFEDLTNSKWLEPGYYAINVIANEFIGKFFGVTLLTGVITLVFFYSGAKSLTRFFAFTYFLFLVSPSGYGFIVNGMRQGIAVAIFFYASKFIVEKQLFRYVVFIVFAALFHKSAILLLLVYPIAHIKLKPIYYLISFLGALLLSFFKVFYNVFISILSLTPYGKYVLLDDMIKNVETNSGLGFHFTNLVGVFVLIFARKIINRGSAALVYFNLYFLFLVLRNVLFDIKILYRFIVYFDWFSFLVIPFFVYYSFTDKSRKVVCIVLILAYSLIFIKAINNESYKLIYHLVSF